MTNYEIAFRRNRLQQTRPILGCGIVANGMATPIPMWAKPNGRWIGKVS